MAEAEELVHRLAGLTISRPLKVNYADHQTANLMRMPNPLLAQDIVILGEGDFTFSVALAALLTRENAHLNPWERITTTWFDSPPDGDIQKLVQEMKLKCIKFCIFNGRKLNVDDTTILNNVSSLLCLQQPPQDCRRAICRFGVDATSIPTNLDLMGKTVWFQCPWNSQGHTHTLITNFLRHVGAWGPKYILLGITKQFPYVKEYSLQGILEGDCGFTRMSAELRRSIPYRFLGADDQLIKQILLLGYHHTGVKDIHEKILEDHITLVFEYNVN